MYNHHYIKCSRGSIYTVSYIKQEDAPYLVILPPVGWYNSGPHRIFSQLAKKVMNIGMNVLIFDYLNQGESSGNCIDMTYEDLKVSVDTILDYVKQFKSPIYCMGYGLGNKYCKMLLQDDCIDGGIFYLPSLETTISYSEVFSKEEISDANERGYFKAELEQEKYTFWKQIIGAYHDYIVNPISINIVTQSENTNDLDYIKNCQKPLLVISDRDMELSNHPNVSIHYSERLEKNIMPGDWEVNTWPLELDQINSSCAEWLQSQISSLNDTKKGTSNVDKNILRNEYKKDKVERILVKFDSDGVRCLGVLHVPAERSTEKISCAIFTTGLGGDKMESHVCGARLGDYLAEHGIAFFRYDTKFTGTSTECLADCTITKLKKNYEDAIEYLVDTFEILDSKRFFGIGWSEGAKIILAAQTRADVIAACFWNAVLVDNNTPTQSGSDAGNSLRSFYRSPNSRKLIRSISKAGEWLGFEYISDNKKNDCLPYLDQKQMEIMMIWGSEDLENNNYKILGSKPYYQEVVQTDRHIFSYEVMDSIFKLSQKWLSKFL